MIRIKRKNAEGFTLVELMIVVAIIGILAVLAVYGVTRYMKNAKTGEARNALGQLAKSAVGAYEAERSDGVLLAPGASGAANLHRVCSSAARVPVALTSVQNKKYQSTQGAADWGAGDRDTGWVCLKFSITEPQYFQYGYLADVATNAWSAQADGALEGGTTADIGFSITGKAVGTPLQMTVAQNLLETNGAAPTALP